MERWVAEIKLRAITRIGEISAELEEVSREDRGRMAHGALPTDGNCSKSAVVEHFAGALHASARHVQHFGGLRLGGCLN